jgi:ABC-type transporter Mla MlaB component
MENRPCATGRPAYCAAGMAITAGAIAVRPGEHACFRFRRPEERERIADAFVCAGLGRGHRVVYLCESRDLDATCRRLTSAEPEMASAIRTGALEVRDARGTYLQGRSFDVEQIIAALRAEHRRALTDGFAGLSMTGDVVSALVDASAEQLVEYEHRLNEEFGDATQVLLCQYDQHRFETGTLAEMTEAHHVEVSPLLATMDPTGALAAARVHPPETLRLAGELDFETVVGLLEYVTANVHGALRVDLADIVFADVAGMRALRAGPHGRLTIADASEPVLRLVGLLGWDTDPAVRVAT